MSEVKTPKLELFQKIKVKSGLKLDLFANFAGGGWTGLAQFVAIPLYIKFLGVAGYGLIGFYLVLQAILQVLDFGLSPTINREMARYSVQPEKAAESRDLVRTLEAGYWLIGLAIGAGVWAAAPWIAAHWIKAETFPIQTIQQALRIMGILALFQWPVTLYQGALMGLGRQVLFNVLRICQVTLTHGGALLVLWLVSQSIQAYFMWVSVVAAAYTVTLAISVWKSLPHLVPAPRFNLKLSRNIWRFAAGMSGITAGTLILTQMDKVILSKLFSLKVFGYYALAGMFGSGLMMIVSSVFNTIFPRFSALVAAHDEEALKRLYHSATQLMAVLIIPVTAVVAVHSRSIVLLWTRNAEVARNAGPIATVLVIGSALNGLMYLPYALQLANGWTSFALRICIFLTVTLVPAIWFMATSYGPVGAASVWVALNVIYMLIGVPVTHRRLLQGEAWRWMGDIGRPLVPVLLAAFIFKGLFVATMSTPAAICALLATLFFSMGAAALVSPSIRPWLLNQVFRAKTLC